MIDFFGTYKTLLILTLLSLIIACSPSVKHPDLKVTKSENWLAEDQIYAYIDSAWWEEFQNDNLDTLIAHVYKYNYSLMAASARMEAAEAQKTIASAGLFPALGIGTDGSRRKQSLVTFPEQIRSLITNPVNTFGVSANISWELDLWGKIRSVRSASVAQYEASQADYEGFKLSLAAQAIKGWFAATEANRQLKLAETILKSYQLSEERIFARYQKGIRPSLDYRLSRTTVANAESQLYQRSQQADQSKRQLEILAGRYPAATIAVGESLTFQLNDIPAGIPADILTRRPDIVAAERKLAAAQCNVTAAEAALFPTISLTASAGTSTTELSEILNQDFSVWSLAANVFQPIFQGGRLRANVKLNQALQKQAFAEYAQTVLRAYAEIEGILSGDEYFKKQEAAIKIAAVEANAALLLAENRYYKGLADIITLLDSRRQAANAESQLLTIQRLRLENRVDFYVALGGGLSFLENKENENKTELK